MIISDNAEKLKMILGNFDYSLGQQLAEVIVDQITGHKIYSVDLCPMAYQFPLGRIQLAMKYLPESGDILKTFECKQELEEALLCFEKSQLGKYMAPELVTVDNVSDRVKLVNERMSKLFLTGYGKKCDYSADELYRDGGIRSLVSLYEILNIIWKQLSEMLQTKYFPEMHSSLKFSLSLELLDNPKFLVHFFRSPVELYSPRRIVSCSLITRNCKKTRSELGWGFAYVPSCPELLGMCPDDMYTSERDVRLASNPVGDLFASMFDEIQLDRVKFLVSRVGSGVLPVYPLDEFEKLSHSTGTYNEVLLSYAVPEAVFAFEDAFNENKRRIVATGISINRPLIIYNKETDKYRRLEVSELPALIESDRTE